MIFVTVGMGRSPFDRLLRAVERLEVDEPIVVQYGASRVRPRNAVCHQFLEFHNLTEYVRAARVVVTHAGVGSIMVALANDKRPIVVPRVRRLGEVNDDHQAPLARLLHEAGLVTLLHDEARLPDVVAAASTPPAVDLTGSVRLARELREYVERAVDGRG